MVHRMVVTREAITGRLLAGCCCGWTAEQSYATAAAVLYAHLDHLTAAAAGATAV